MSHVTPSPPPPSPADPRSVGSDAFASLIYSAVVRLGTVGLSVAAARLGGAWSAGALGVALQFVGLASLLATFNLPQALAQRLPRTATAAERTRLLGVSAALVGGCAALTGLASVVAAPWLAGSLYSDPSLTGVLRACGPLIMAGAAYMWVEGALQGRRLFAPMARWGVGVAVADLASGIASAFFGVWAMLLTRAVVRAASAAFALRRWLRREDEARTAAAMPPAHSRTKLAGELLRFGGPAFAAGSMLLLGNALLRALLVRSSGLEEAGHLQAADSLAQGLLLVPLAASNAFMPAAAERLANSAEEQAKLFRRAIERVTGVGVSLCLIAMALAPWAVEMVFGHEFAAAREALVWLACGYGMITPGSIYGAWLTARGRVTTILVVQILWAAVVLFVFHNVTSANGAAGVAQACTVGYTLALALYAFFVAPRIGLPWASHLPVALGGAVALLAGAAIALATAWPAPLRAALELVLAGVLLLRWTFPQLVPRRAGDRS